MKTPAPSIERLLSTDLGSRPACVRGPARSIAVVVLRLAVLPLATLLFAVAELAAVTVPPSEYVEGELLVKFADGPFSGQADQGNAWVGAEVVRAFPACGWQHVRLPIGMTVREALAAYAALPGVVAAEPDYYFQPAGGSDTPPDDPMLPDQWGLAKIVAPHAWTLTTGSREVVVAVIDSGVRYDHEDLAANMWRNPGETGLDDSGLEKSTNGIDDDTNGYVDDLYGIDVAAGDSDPMDQGVQGLTWGHGTCVAGILGAVGDNGKGVAGVNWEVQIMALRVLGTGASFTTTKLLAAFEYVTMMKQRGANVRVTNNSYGTSSMPQSLKDAMDAAGALGILHACAAANDGKNTDLEPRYPACYGSPNIVSVTSSSQADGDTGDNYGPKSVDLAAPGQMIATTSHLDAANYVNDFPATSAATPFVAGALALLAALDPAQPGTALKAAVLDSVDVLPAFTGRVVSDGRLNVGRAAELLIAPDAPSVVIAAQSLPDPATLVAPIEMSFSKPMNPASVESAFRLPPAVEGTFAWSNLDRTVRFQPATLWASASVIEVRLSGNAADATGTTIDGNGNRLSEGPDTDDFVWTFRTLPTSVAQIERITPSSGVIGSAVTLYGVGFTGASEVRFDGVPAQFNTFPHREETMIRAFVPVGATTGPVTVTNPLGTATSEGLFTVVVPDPLPAVALAAVERSTYTITWPISAAAAVLESTDNLEAGQWDTVAADPVLADDQYSVTLEAEGGNRFFRLRYQP